MPDSGCESFVENSEHSQSSTRPLRVITQYPNVDQNMQSPGRPTSLGVCMDNSQFLKGVSRTIFSQDCIPQQWSVKSEDSSELDKFLGQLNNNGSTPVTPTSFLNPNNITEDQERFADDFSRTLNKVKAEQEGWASLDCSNSGANSFAAQLLSRRILCSDDQEQQSSVLDPQKEGGQSGDEVALSHFIVGSASSSEASSIGLHGVSSGSTVDFSCVTSAFLTTDPLVLLSTGTGKDTTTTTSCSIPNGKLQNMNSSVRMQDSVALCMTGEINDDEGNITLTDLPASAFGQLIVSPISGSTTDPVDNSRSRWTASLPTILSIASCSTTDSLSNTHPSYTADPGSANYTDLLFSGCQVVRPHSISSVSTEVGCQQQRQQHHHHHQQQASICTSNGSRSGSGSSSSSSRDNHVPGSGAFILSAASIATDNSTSLNNATAGMTLLHYPSATTSTGTATTTTTAAAATTTATITASTATTGGVCSSGSRHLRHCRFAPTVDIAVDSLATTATTPACSPYSDGGTTGKREFETNSFGEQTKQGVVATPITVLFARSPPVLSSHNDILTTSNSTSSGHSMLINSQPIRCSSVASLTSDAPANGSLNQQQQQHMRHQMYTDLMDPGPNNGVTALPTITLAAKNTSGLMDHCTSTLLLQHPGSSDVGNTDPVTFIPTSNSVSQNGILPSSFQTLASSGMLVRNGAVDGQLTGILNPLISTSLAHLPTTDNANIVPTISTVAAPAVLDDSSLGLPSALLPPLHPIPQQPYLNTVSSTAQALPPPTKRSKRLSGSTTASKQHFRSAAIQADPMYRLFDNQIASTGAGNDLTHPPHRIPVNRPVKSDQSALEPSASDSKPVGDSFMATDRHTEESCGLQLATPPSSLDGSGDKDEWKLERKRARNRVAARRCRERKISLIRALENQVAERDAHVRSLEETLARYRSEGERLRGHIEQLANTYPSLKAELCKLHFLPRPDAQS